MKKKNTDIENTLPKLPDGFDHGRIVMPDKVRRGTANTLRLYKSDYNPIERSGFKGFFAIPNRMHGGTKESIAERAKTLIANGGAVFLMKNNVKADDEGFRKAAVRLVEAYSYREGKYVVLHIEPIK